MKQLSSVERRPMLVNQNGTPYYQEKEPPLWETPMARLILLQPNQLLWEQNTFADSFAIPIFGSLAIKYAGKIIHFVEEEEFTGDAVLENLYSSKTQKNILRSANVIANPYSLKQVVIVVEFIAESFFYKLKKRYEPVKPGSIAYYFALPMLEHIYINMHRSVTMHKEHSERLKDLGVKNIFDKRKKLIDSDVDRAMESFFSSTTTEEYTKAVQFMQSVRNTSRSFWLYNSLLHPVVEKKGAVEKAKQAHSQRAASYYGQDRKITYYEIIQYLQERCDFPKSVISSLNDLKVQLERGYIRNVYEAKAHLYRLAMSR